MTQIANLREMRGIWDNFEEEFEVSEQRGRLEVSDKDEYSWEHSSTALPLFCKWGCSSSFGRFSIFS